MTTQDIKEIPPEKLGFEGFILNYTWNSNVSERNKYIISLFPGDLWKEAKFSADDATKYADILCQSEDVLPKIVAESKDKYLEEIAPQIYNAYYLMRVATLWDKGMLMSDDKWKSNFAEVARAEFQLLGFKMFSALPLEHKKEFLDKAASSDMPPYALRLWADYAYTPIAENDIIPGSEKRSFPRTHLSDIIEKVGFISAIAWLRELPNYRNFENWANKLSEFLLDSEKLKSYAMFDSAFFPYINKV